MGTADDTAGRRMRAEITAISDCNVANGRQSKTDVSIGAAARIPFLRDIKMNPQFFKPHERRKMFRVPAAIMTGGNNPCKCNGRVVP